MDDVHSSNLRWLQESGRKTQPAKPAESARVQADLGTAERWTCRYFCPRKPTAPVNNLELIKQLELLKESLHLDRRRQVLQLSDFSQPGLRQEDLLQFYRQQFSQLFQILDFAPGLKAELQENSLSFSLRRAQLAAQSREVLQELDLIFLTHALRNMTIDFEFVSSRDHLGARFTDYIGYFEKFWRSYDFQIDLSDALVYFNSSPIPLYLADRDSGVLKKPKAYSLIQFVEDQKNVVDRISEFFLNAVKLFQFFWPTLIGIFDKIGDIIYANKCFADDYLRNMFIFFLVFPAVLQAIVWNIYLSKRRYRKLEAQSSRREPSG